MATLQELQTQREDLQVKIDRMDALSAESDAAFADGQAELVSISLQAALLQAEASTLTNGHRYQIEQWLDANEACYQRVQKKIVLLDTQRTRAAETRTMALVVLAQFDKRIAALQVP
jgi:hypothetical protein